MLNIIDGVIKYLSFNSDKRDQFKALCNIAVWFICRSYFVKIEQQQSYKDSILKLSEFLEINESQLVFILDLLSGNPNRIYGLGETEVDDKFDFKDVQNDIHLNQSRSILISEATDLSFNEVQKVGLFWVYHYNLTSKGQSFMKVLSEDILGIHNDFFKILTQKAEEDQGKGPTRKQNIHRFLRQRLLDLKEGKNKWVNTQEDGPINRLTKCYKMSYEASSKNKQLLQDVQKDYFTKKFSYEDQDAKFFFQLSYTIVLIVEGDKDTFRKLMSNYERGVDLLYYVYKVFTGEFQYMLSTLMYI